MSHAHAASPPSCGGCPKGGAHSCRARPWSASPSVCGTSRPGRCCPSGTSPSCTLSRGISHGRRSASRPARPPGGRSRSPAGTPSGAGGWPSSGRWPLRRRCGPHGWSLCPGRWWRCCAGVTPGPAQGCCREQCRRWPTSGEGRASGHRTSRRHHKCPGPHTCGSCPKLSSPPARGRAPCGFSWCSRAARQGSRPCACGPFPPRCGWSQTDANSRTSLSSRLSAACISVSC